MKREETRDEVREMMCLLGLSGERGVYVEASSLRAGNLSRVTCAPSKTSLFSFTELFLSTTNLLRKPFQEGHLN